MRKLLLIAITFILASCATYPDISGLPPQQALAQLASYEQELNTGEAQLRSDMANPVAGPPGAFIAAGEAMAGPMMEMGLQTIATDRERLVRDRERIYQANPSLRPRGTTSSQVAAGSQIAVGMSGNITTSGLCGLPRSQVSDANRRSLHAEASKSSSFSFPFQTTSQVVAEYNRTGAQGCAAIGQQFQASMNGFRGAMATADRLNNGTSRGVQCDPSTGSASSASYCAATALLYQVQTVSALCHAVCN